MVYSLRGHPPNSDNMKNVILNCYFPIQQLRGTLIHGWQYRVLQIGCFFSDHRRCNDGCQSQWRQPRPQIWTYTTQIQRANHAGQPRLANNATKPPVRVRAPAHFCRQFQETPFQLHMLLTVWTQKHRRRHSKLVGRARPHLWPSPNITF